MTKMSCVSYELCFELLQLYINLHVREKGRWVRNESNTSLVSGKTYYKLVAKKEGCVFDTHTHIHIHTCK